MTVSGQWFALHVRRNYEGVIDKTLREKGFESYLPLISERRRWKHRFKRLKVPLFPNYSFVKFDLSDKLEIVTIKGVIAIVGQPTAIPDMQIEAVQAVVESKLKKDYYPFLVEGRPVRITRGPLMGKEGVLVRKDGVASFVVNVPMLGRSVGVEVDPANLEAL